MFPTTLKALQSLRTEIQNHRVDLLTDNQAVKCAWQNQGGKDNQLNGIMKQIFQLVFEKIDLQMHYIPPKLNPAIRAYREVDMMETTLYEKSAREVDIVFDPHSVDLMASESNVHHSIDGVALRYFSQTKHHRHQEFIYRWNAIPMFRPFALIFPVIRYLQELIFPVLRYLQEHKVKRYKFIAPLFSLITV